MEIKELIEWMEENTLDLRCVDDPNDSSDYYWTVVEHYMTEPKERIVGQGSTVEQALLVAFFDANKEPATEEAARKTVRPYTGKSAIPRNGYDDEGYPRWDPTQIC